MQTLTKPPMTPPPLSDATSGVGNPQHLNGELLEEVAGIFMVHVPYRGAAGQMVDAVVQAMRQPDLAKRMTDQGGLPAPMSPTQFRDFIKTESVQYARLVEFAKITPDN